MALKKRSYPTEILIRLDPDGGVRGMHVKNIEEILDGKAVVSAREDPARPLTEAEFGKIVGDLPARLNEQLDQLRAEGARLLKEADDAKSKASDAIVRAENAEGTLKALREENSLRAQQSAAAATEAAAKPPAP